MDKTRITTLMENEDVRELLDIMNANNMSETVHLLDLIAYVGETEKLLGVAVSELQSMRRELAEAQRQNHPIKNALKNAVTVMQNQALELRDNISALKQDIADGCKNAVAAFKEQGVSALRSFADFFKIRPSLENLRDNVYMSIKQNEAAVAKIDAVSAEYHKAGLHMKNMGRALTGKEAIQEAKPSGKLAAAVKAPYRADMACLTAMLRCSNAAIGSVARLESSERRQPVMATIKKLNNEIEQAQKTAAHKVRPRPVTHDER